MPSVNLTCLTEQDCYAEGVVTFGYWGEIMTKRHFTLAFEIGSIAIFAIVLAFLGYCAVHAYLGLGDQFPHLDV
ncbi:hypothetical protein [Rosenbergiella metrosideri]|uniref:hypothetical protein n=1 Tax=Rosenbergiella metrosideri TaxID=2921185 RepID=UPI001F4F7CD6|nr:hypothetical protein [Rosenbergiella metrosideri]